MQNQTGIVRVFQKELDDENHGWPKYDTQGLGKVNKDTARLIVTSLLRFYCRSTDRISDEEFDARYNSLEVDGFIFKEDISVLIS